MGREILYTSSYGAYVMSASGVSSYGTFAGIVGDSYTQGSGYTITTRYYRWNTVPSVKAYPGDDGVTVKEFQITVNAGKAWNANPLNGLETTGTISVCVPDVPYSYAMSGEQIVNRAKAAKEIATCTTGRISEIPVTDVQTMEKILRNGIVLRAKSGGWNATAEATSITYDYAAQNEPPVVEITSCPHSVFLCDNIPIAWSYSHSANVAQSRVDVALFEYEYTEPSYMLAASAATSEQQYTVSLKDTDIFNPEILPDKVWRIGVRAYSASASEPSAWAFSGNIKLRDVMAKLISPVKGENKIASDPIDLVWGLKEYPTGDPYAFLVDVSADGGDTWTSTTILYVDAVRDGENWKYTIPAGTLPNGTVQWRVFVYTTQDSFNPYADKETFYAVVQASTSAVMCDGKPLPTLSWESTAQAAYQVRFADYDSGAVYGSGKSHTVPYVYADGLYAAQVRTQATTGKWSAWSEVQYVQIRNSAPAGSFGLTAEKTRNAVKLSWTPTGSFEGYVLYRGKTPIYAGKERSFVDVMGNGKNTYTVRAVTEDKYYAQSAEVIADATPEADCIYRVSTGEWLSLKYSTAPRRRQFTDNKRVSYKYYAGRKYPVTFTEGFSERVGSFSYCFREREQADAVAALAGETVVYKGTDGSLIRGTLNGVSRLREIVSDITFTITETDYEEKVPYAAS